MHRVSDIGSVIEVVVTGLVDEASALTACEDAAAAARRGGLSTVLLDVSAVALSQLESSSTMTLSIYKVHTAMASIFAPETRVAVVATPGSRPREVTEFAETVSANRGLELRFFACREAALTWLHDPSRSAAAG